MGCILIIAIFFLIRKVEKINKGEEEYENIIQFEYMTVQTHRSRQSNDTF